MIEPISFPPIHFQIAPALLALRNRRPIRRRFRATSSTPSIC